MKFAAYDKLAIYGLGSSPDEALKDARQQARDPEATFDIARISDAFAAYIEKNGWDGHRNTFDVRDGELFDTTG